MINMGLRRQYMCRGSRTNCIENSFVMHRLITHPRIDDDASSIMNNHVDRRRPI